MAETKEVRTAPTSPVPPKFVEVFPKPPQSVKQDEDKPLMSWGQAMNELIQYRKIRRASWPEGYMLELINDEMTLRKPDNSLTTMIIHKVDLLAPDWVTV